MIKRTASSTAVSAELFCPASCSKSGDRSEEMSLGFLARTGSLQRTAEFERDLDRERGAAAAHYVKAGDVASQLAHQRDAGLDRHPPRMFLFQARIAVEMSMRAGKIGNALLQIGGHRFALDRQDTEHHAQTMAARLLNKGARDPGIEHGLGDDELGAGARLALEQFEFALQRLAIRIGHRADCKLGQRFQQAAALTG